MRKKKVSVDPPGKAPPHRLQSLARGQATQACIFFVGLQTKKESEQQQAHGARGKSPTSPQSSFTSPCLIILSKALGDRKKRWKVMIKHRICPHNLLSFDFLVPHKQQSAKKWSKMMTGTKQDTFLEQTKKRERCVCSR